MKEDSALQLKREFDKGTDISIQKCNHGFHYSKKVV